MMWLNEPASWSRTESELIISPDEGSDFWRITNYGFVHDNGHAWLERVDGDFDAAVELAADYREQYDQAGLMIRVDPENWLKTGIEYVDGRCFLSAVVTRGFSDWSIAPLDRRPETVAVRIHRRGDSITIETSADGAPFQTLRITHLPPGPDSAVGPAACAPSASGFTARFTKFKIEQR